MRLLTGCKTVICMVGMGKAVISNKSPKVGGRNAAASLASFQCDTTVAWELLESGTASSDLVRERIRTFPSCLHSKGTNLPLILNISL